MKVNGKNWMIASLLVTLLFGGLLTENSSADDRTLDLKIFKVQAPEKWVKKTPRSRIVAFEYAAPAAKDDPADGRLTVMQAGGSVKANIERWEGQFSNTVGDPKKTEKEIKGFKVHFVDITGTFQDRPRPFGPAVEREKYRMLGAIVVAKDAQIFFKMTGPARTLAEHEKEFTKMVEELKLP